MTAPMGTKGRRRLKQAAKPNAKSLKKRCEAAVEAVMAKNVSMADRQRLMVGAMVRVAKQHALRVWLKRINLIG